MKHNVTVPHELIAKRAYLLWEAAGHPHGRENEFWLEAESIELAEFTKNASKQAKKSTAPAKTDAVASQEVPEKSPKKKTTAKKKSR